MRLIWRSHLESLSDSAAELRRGRLVKSALAGKRRGRAAVAGRAVAGPRLRTHSVNLDPLANGSYRPIQAAS